MVLGNPHFPWDGAERFYQAHLTIPGQVDVAGGAPVRRAGGADRPHARARVEPHRLHRLPLHAVRAEARARLADHVPRRRAAAADDRRRGDRRRRAGPTARSSSARARSTRRATGRSSPRSSGCRCSRGRPPTAFALGDANAGNFRYLNHFFETNRAQCVARVDAILRRNQGIPWVNTIAADSTGEAYYADIAVVPNVSDAQGARLQHARSGQATFTALRPAGARRLALGLRLGRRPRRGRSPACSARATCRRCSATTT